MAENGNEAPYELFTVKDVARIFNISESRIRYWAQTGFINPSVVRKGRRYYTFLDLISIKTAVELLNSGLSLQKVRKNLETLRSLLPKVDKPLSRLRIRSDGDRLVVVSEDVVFDAETGQVLLDFSTGHFRDHVVQLLDLGRPVRKSERLPDEEEPGGPPPHQRAYAWFLEGLRLDQQDETLEQAADA